MAKEQDAAEPTLESLEPIRQSIRRLCAQDQFTWEQSWKSVLSDVNQVRRGLLLPDVFQQTLELNEIRLTRKALQSVVEQFQLPNGAVQAHKFLQWIDLTKPNDHVDPDLAFARLPQPYRRIVKVLESDILDAAWAQIQATSAKYKAETSAALSARSARSSVLLMHAPEDASALQDDYAAAKKRCCKPKGELSRPARAESVVALKVHSTRPFAVLCWHGSDDSGPVLTLELIHTQLQTSLGSILVDIPVAGGATSELPVNRTLEVLSTSELRSRPVADTTESPDEATRLVLAIHVRETVPTADAAVSVDHVLVYEFAVSTAMELSTAILLTSLVFSDPSEVIVALTLSHEVSLLAVATTKSETGVYSVPSPPTPTETTETEPTTPIPTPTPPTLTLVTKLPTDAPATAVHFLYPPIVDLPMRPRSSSVTLSPYAVAVAAAKSLVKFRLPTTNSDTSTVSAKWPHLTTITSCSADSTSQFITVGLADGLVVVWDLLADRNHVMLTPPPSSTPPSSVGNAVDLAFFCGEQFVVSLSLASQRLCFYDIADRAAPSLLRVVTPPPPSNTTTANAAASEPIRFVFVSPYSPLLDVPIAVVAYSNGYVMLYDVRNGEAMASIRVSKEALETRTIDIAPANSAVVAVTPSPVVFDWGDLLTTAFPSLPSVLQSKRLEPSVENVKREFIASVDVSAGGVFSGGAMLSIGAKPSLHSMLLASAGHSHAGKSPMDALLSGSTSSSSLSQTATNSDSRTSLATTTSGVTTTAPSREREPLPSLLECAAYPYKPTFSALFERFCEEEINAAAGASAEAKVHRRRNELLKILTAAW